MGWNGSGSAPKDIKKDTGAKRSSIKLISALVIGLFLVLAVFSVLFPRCTKTKTKANIKTSKSEIQLQSREGVPSKLPAKVTVNPVASSKPEVKTDVSVHNEELIVVQAPKSEEEMIFKHSSDQELASLLLFEPGECLVGESDMYYDDFARRFVASLNDPIEYDKNDDQFVKELKAGVSAMREELKSRFNAGENLEKVLRDTREEYRKLALYRQELEQMVIEQTQTEEMTEEGYDDIVKAANLMLSERGVKPLSLPIAFKHRIRLKSVGKQ